MKNLLTIYRKWSPTRRIFFWMGVLGLFIPICFGIAELIFKTAPIIERDITTEKPPVTNYDSQCKSEAWVVKTLDTGQAVYLDDCDYACREMNNPENMESITLLFSLNRLWKKASSTEFQIINLSNTVSVFIENNQLNLRVVERNGRIQLLTNNAPYNWYLNEWHNMAIGINNKGNLKIYIDQILIIQKDVPDLDVDFNDIILCLGSKNNKDTPFLIDNLFVSAGPVENYLQHFKKEDGDQQTILDIFDKIKSFLLDLKIEF